MGTVRIIVEQIKSEISAPDEAIFAAAQKRIRASGLFSVVGNLAINRRSIDARDRSRIHFVSSVGIFCKADGFD